MRTLLCAVLLCLFGVITVPAHAQFFKKLGDEVTKRVENKVINDAGRAAEKGVDKAERAPGKAIKKEKNKQEPSPSNSNANKRTAEGEKTAGGEEVAKQQGMGNVETGYDFKPGDRVLFETDFSDAVVGNFPRNLEFRGGQLSVVSYDGGRAIKANTTGAFAIKLSEKLPDMFTIEFNEFNSEFVNDMKVQVVDEEFKAVGNHYVQITGGGHGSGVAAYKRGGITSLQKTPMINKEMTPIRVMVDGSYVKVYAGETRIANMPSADLGRSNILLFNFTDVRGKPIYVADIRIAAGGRSLYQTLEAEGRVAIHDIHFATGKADILPSSAATIKTVAELLQKHTDLRLLIEGHTDNIGEFDKNMQLSKDRADAVKNYLVNKFGIKADRLRTMGQGQSQPVASNDTEEGRAENRRVEIVKM